MKPMSNSIRVSESHRLRRREADCTEIHLMEMILAIIISWKQYGIYEMPVAEREVTFK